MSLRLDWCSHEAAKFAVMNWHYSKTMPVGRLVKVGVWEDEAFVGCVVFAQGNNQYQGRDFGLGVFEVCELVRVALRPHKAAVTRIVALALKFLKRFCPGVRLVVSYADPAHGHHGGIYQGGNWTYVGVGGSSEAFYDASGRRLHSRSISKTGVKIQFGTPHRKTAAALATRVSLEPKHKYLMGLDAEMRARIAPLAKPYPKRARSTDSDAPGDQPGEGGAIPTRALQTTEANDG